MPLGDPRLDRGAELARRERDREQLDRAFGPDGADLGPGVREYEPDEALFAGREGLDAYRELAPQLPRLLERGGLAAIEIGYDQAESVTRLMARDGLKAEVAYDLGNRPRCVLLTWA